MGLKKGLCPHCGDSKFISSGFTEKMICGKRVLYPYAQPCYCEINRQIEHRFDIFSPFPPATPEDAEKAHKRYEERNIRFQGKEDLFLYMVKSFFLKGFISKDYLIIEGRRIVDEYHAPQKDGSRLTIDALNQYDLLVILFTSNTKYETLQNCVADIVKNRLRLARPTWIYAESEDSMKKNSEYSEALEVYLAKYRVVDIEKKYDYEGYKQGKTQEMKIKKSRDINDNLAR